MAKRPLVPRARILTLPWKLVRWADFLKAEANECLSLLSTFSDLHGPRGHHTMVSAGHLILVKRPSKVLLWSQSWRGEYQVMECLLSGFHATSSNLERSGAEGPLPGWAFPMGSLRQCVGECGLAPTDRACYADPLVSTKAQVRLPVASIAGTLLFCKFFRHSRPACLGWVMDTYGAAAFIDGMGLSFEPSRLPVSLGLREVAGVGQDLREETWFFWP